MAIVMFRLTLPSGIIRAINPMRVMSIAPDTDTGGCEVAFGLTDKGDWIYEAFTESAPEAQIRWQAAMAGLSFVADGAASEAP